MSIISSLFWKFMERSGNQIIQVAVQIVLARLLVPSDFGMIALVLVFINLGQVFVQSGLNTALIQAKHASDVDFSSVFYISLFVAGVLYVVLYFTSPYIATFYEMSALCHVLRFLSLILFFGAVTSIQNAVVSREFKFKQLFYSSLGAALCSGAIGIAMALRGFGIWALVWQQLTNQFFLCVIMWFTVRWRPKLLFSLVRVRILLAFGWKLLISALLDTGYREMQNLVIGKMFAPSTLGFFNRGQIFPQVIVGNIDGSIQAVMLPALSREQDNPRRVKEMMRRAITMSSFIIAPLMMGLIATAEPVVKIVLTDKWLPCVPFIRICCLSFILYPIHTANLQAINALGRSDIFLKLEIIKKIMGISVLMFAIICWGSVMAIAWSAVISGIISSFINSYPNKILLKYGYLEQVMDLFPPIIIAAFMGGVVYLLNYIDYNIYIMLMSQILVGVIIYTAASKLFKIESFDYFLCMVLSLIRKQEI
ncbi:MAG: lipopolysaccharide biosynthesis protein [Cloacibacillus sp.]